MAEEQTEFQALADALPHAVWISRRNGALSWLNHRATDYFGLPFREVSRRLRDGALLHPDDRDGFTAAWASAVQSGQPFSADARMRRFDGAMRWHQFRATPIRTSEGAIKRWLGTAVDVHDVREASDRGAFLLALSAELARIRNPQELICSAMARLGERLGASRIVLAEIEGEEAVLLKQSRPDDVRIETVRLPHVQFDSLADDSRLGLTAVVSDSRVDRRTAPHHPQWYGPERIGALVSAPLLEGGVVVALFSVIHERSHDWTDAEVELVNRVADIVWPALQKSRADRRVARSEERLRLAQAVAQIGAWEWDPESRALFFSPESYELFGLDSGESNVYEQWLTRVDPEDVESVLRVLEACTSHGAAEFEYRYHHPERGPGWIYSKAGLVQHGSERYVVGISLDVTARRQAEEKLKEMSQRKDEFLAMLAHELRNPLAPIRHAAQILGTHAEGKPQLEWVRSVIERQTRHLVRLVDDLLDVSRMMRGQIVLKKSVLELKEIVRHAVETSRPLIRTRRHRLRVTLPEEPVRVEGDLTRLAQVLANLLNNAAKYTDVGGQIWLDACVEGESVVIRVRDNGPGIAPSLLPHVFEMFTQANRTLDRAQGGLGIGLTLVKRLVEMHGGRVEARSDGIGKGAELIVRLPVLATTHGTQAEKNMAERSDAAAGLRILVVDDNADAAESIAILLSMEGHETQTVNNAHDALTAASEFRPHVVLLDIGLPEMDGYEVARRLRSQNAIQSMRLVAVTGYGQPGDRARAQEAGFDEHLVKPVEPATLNELLKSVQIPCRE